MVERRDGLISSIEYNAFVKLIAHALHKVGVRWKMGSGRGGLKSLPMADRWRGGEAEKTNEAGKVKLVVTRQWEDSRRPKSDALSDF